jgi:hypothetical protein
LEYKSQQHHSSVLKPAESNASVANKSKSVVLENESQSKASEPGESGDHASSTEESESFEVLDP